MSSFADHLGALQPPLWSAIFAMLAVGVAYVATRLNLRHKQLDFIMYDNKQFDELQKKRLEIRIVEAAKRAGNDESEATKARLTLEATMFFERFWTLQFDGFIAWYEGYLPTSLYTYWLFARWRELSEPSAEWTLAEQTLKSSLDSIRKRWASNPDPNSMQTVQVGKFLNLMLDLGTGRMIDIGSLLKKHGPSSTKRRLRKFFGAY